METAVFVNWVKWRVLGRYKVSWQTANLGFEIRTQSEARRLWEILGECQHNVEA